MPRCLALSGEAGWNQTAEDWLTPIRHGRIDGVVTDSGELIATGAVLPLENGIGWICMMLVSSDWRRQGIGRAMMKGLISSSGHSVFALDATPYGRPLYEQFGFARQEEIVRYRIQRPEKPRLQRQDSGGSPPQFSGFARVIAQREDAVALASGSAQGLVRPGRFAIQIGPVISSVESDAVTIVEVALDRSEGDLCIDVPMRAGTFSRRLERMGFEPVRSLVRMARACAYLAAPGTFAIAGPEYG